MSTHSSSLYLTLGPGFACALGIGGPPTSWCLFAMPGKCPAQWEGAFLPTAWICLNAVSLSPHLCFAEGTGYQCSFWLPQSVEI